MINNMVMVSKFGLTGLNMKGNTSTEKNKVKEDLTGLMDLLTLGSFAKILYKEKVCIFGQMADNLMVNGKIIKCMGMANFLGQTAEFTKASM